MIDKSIIVRRLTIIKYLYSIGIQQSYQFESVAGLSVLSFHDSAEMFLLLSAENKNIRTDKVEFMKFWDLIPELTLKESMKNLKNLRVAVKHRGQFPSKSDIEASRTTITQFFDQNTESQFGIKFNEISLADLVSYEEVRKILKQAESEYDQKEYFCALVSTRKAFDKLLSDYNDSKCYPHSYHSSFEIGKKVGKDYQRLIGTDSKSGARWFQEVTETSNALREALKLLVLGIDFRKYTFFKAVTPYMNLYVTKDGADYSVEPKEMYEQRHILREEDCLFCINFVIDSALKLQEFDFDMESIVKSLR